MSEALNAATDQIVRYLLIGSVAALTLVSLAWVILKIARIQTSVYCHLIWLDCLIGVVVLPLLWLAGPKLTLPVLPSRVAARAPAVSPLSHDYVGTMAMEESPTVPAETERQSTTGAPPQPVTWQTAVAGLWAAGFAFMLTRLAVGWHRLRRIYLSATPVSQRQVPHALNGHRLTIRLTGQLHGPVCFGLWRPVILLPEEMYEGGSPESLRMVLTHELAHLQRRDAWVNLFQRLVEAVYFFHPFIWLASRQLTQQREQICDNYVLAEGVLPADYTTLLSRIGEQAVRARYPQTVALFEGHLLARIRSLLDPRGSRQTKLPRRVLLVCTLLAVAGFLFPASVRLVARPRVSSSNPTQASSTKEATRDTSKDPRRPTQPLHGAAWDGDMERVRALVTAGVDMNEIYRGDRPLHYAILQGHTGIAEFLITHGANVNLQGNRGTPLHCAAAKGDLRVLALLISRGADIQAKDRRNETALYRAMTSTSAAQKETVELLTKHGADLPAIHLAAFRGDQDKVSRLLAEGTRIQATDSLGLTPLHAGVCGGQRSLAEFLLQKDADIKVKDSFHRTPLHCAAMLGRRDLAAFLIAKGAEVDAGHEGGETPLDLAVSNDRKETAQLLIDKGASLDNDKDGLFAPLHYAVWSGRKEMVEFLLDKGVRVDPKDMLDFTPLYHAVFQNEKEMLKLLLDKGADGQAESRGGFTAVFYAAAVDLDLVEMLDRASGQTATIHAATRSGNLERVKGFVEDGIPVDTRDSNGMTALCWAVKMGHQGLAEFLISRGADVNAKTKDGSSPLLSAASYGRTELARLLLEKGANLDSDAKPTRNPELAAESNRHWDTVELLRAHRRAKK